MKQFYCVVAEILKSRYSGTTQAVISRACGEKPKNRYTEKREMTAFNIWFDNKSEANELCENVKTGDVGIDTLLSLFNAGETI